MGAWDSESFDNDDAMDWVTEFSEKPGKRLIQKTLKAVIESEEDELEAPESSCAIAAAEVVAALRNAAHPDLGSELQEALSDGKIKVDQLLIDLAIRAVERVKTNSELKELWEEGDSSQWMAATSHLEERLRRPFELPNQGSDSSPQVILPLRIKRAKAGDFLRIPLENNSWSYGRVMAEGRMAFYDLMTSKEVPLSSIIESPIVFYGIMMRYTFNGKTWEVVGHLPLEEHLKKKPLFLHIKSKIDAGVYWATTDFEDRIPVDYETAKTLELLAVYDPIHVEERLNDHFTGRKNGHAEMMRTVK